MFGVEKWVGWKEMCACVYEWGCICYVEAYVYVCELYIYIYILVGTNG